MKNSGGLLHRQISVFYAGREYDLRFGAAELLELVDEMVQFHGGTEGYFDEHGVIAGDAVASISTKRRLVTVQVSFYNGRNVIRKEGKDTCLNEQPSGHFAIQWHIREVLIFTVPERESSRWILSLKELWIRHPQQ